MLLPRMYRVRQTFERPMVKDIRRNGRSELKKLSLEKRVKPGQRVAITAGSRGVANMAEILKATVDFLKSLGAKPFIFPAMGSHGGATAEGQLSLLEHYQITESSMGVPILSSMEAVEIGKTEDGVPVYVDKYALEADQIVVVNRIKPHTKFKAPIESGLMKMMAIGMGKQKGADYYHKAALHYTFYKIIVDAGREVLKKAPILCGLGTVENGYDETAKIVALRPNEIEGEEEKLLAEAKRMMPRLPFDEIDLLIVDEIGKGYQRGGDRSQCDRPKPGPPRCFSSSDKRETDLCAGPDGEFQWKCDRDRPGRYYHKAARGQDRLSGHVYEHHYRYQPGKGCCPHAF